MVATNKTIMIADDTEPLRFLVRATLGERVYRLLEAGDGHEALALARTEHPDLILLDIGMPSLDGYAVCQAIKSDPATSDIRVVMLTGRGHAADRARAVAVGADRYLTKPFSPLELSRLVEELLGSDDAGPNRSSGGSSGRDNPVGSG